MSFIEFVALIEKKGVTLAYQIGEIREWFNHCTKNIKDDVSVQRWLENKLKERDSVFIEQKS